MKISTKARKILLPRLVLSELTTSTSPRAIEIPTAVGSYYVNYLAEDLGDHRLAERPEWMHTKFNLVPIVLDRAGAPWAEASVYLLSRLEGSVAPVMGTYSSIADDLAAYRRFVDESGLDWLTFPQKKFTRPTYRYRAHLGLQIDAGTIAPSTAKRNMSSVIAFYSWLIAENVLHPNNAPWVKTDRYIHYNNSQGMAGRKKIVATDLVIKVAKQSDPYTEYIDDGGKLRPLPEREQLCLLDALIEQGNTELTLIHLFALVTGARIQTVLTLKVSHVVPLSSISSTSGEIRLPIGPRTGIDTKCDKQMVLHIPRWYYEILSTYACSERAIKRRVRAQGGDFSEQYLFLTIHGSPFYTSKADSGKYNSTNVRRHGKAGGAIRQLMKDYLIPSVQRKLNNKFKYRFHDLRATYGMNLTDEQMKRVALGEITLHQAREFVKSRMGHESVATTDRYLQHRGRSQFVRSANNKYTEHLQAIAGQAFKGFL